MKQIQLIKHQLEKISPYYEIFIKMDGCDADYVSEMIKIPAKEFENDELKLLVLSYLLYDQKGYIYEDKNFPWLQEYLGDEDLLLYYCGEPAHSYECIRIIFHDVNGTQYEISLSKLSEVFESTEEMKTYMTNLYNQNYD